MRNARTELIEYVGDKIVDSGYIYIESFSKASKIKVTFDSHIQYLNALDKLDIEYDNGYGSQELFGMVLFTDKSWISREEYDGSEWWETYVPLTREMILNEIKNLK